MIEGCGWINEPGRWSAEGGTLSVTTDKGGDFWRETYYGFERDSGHAYGAWREGSFTAQVRISAGLSHLYDQAGLLVRRGPTRWAKAGLELSDGAPMLAAVVTDGRSDWSVAPFAGDPSGFWLRVTLERGALRIQSSADGRLWPLARLAPFPGEGPCFVAMMACSPGRAGLEASFSGFHVGPPLGRDLHDLS